MGLTHVEGEVKGTAARPRRVTFLIDSGAGYCLLPEPDWKAIGLRPSRSQTFVLADGRRIHRKISACNLRLAGRDGPVTVILGKPGDEALVGAVALESLGLMIDPFRRKLHRMKLRL